jgi:hypothetical protein
MQQYSFTLLVLLLSAVSNFMAIPCQAQTAEDYNTNTNNSNSSGKVSIKENRDERSPVNNTENSTNNKSTVISENTENASSVIANQANLRIPIGSRIFAAPSMQQ